jgi:hypothetical protein
MSSPIIPKRLPALPAVASFLKRLTDAATARLTAICIWLLLLASTGVAQAPLEFRIDPARAAHGFGAWFSGPSSNGSSAGIHYDQNGQPYLKHLPTLDPRDSAYNFYDGTAGEIMSVGASDVVNNIADLRNRSFVPLSGSAKLYIALPSQRSGHTFVIFEPLTGMAAPVTMTTRTASFGPNSGDYFVEGFATVSPGAGWYVVDLTSHERGPAEKSYLPGENWTIDLTGVPLDEMTFEFSGQDAGYYFTLRYQFPGTTELMQRIVPSLLGSTATAYASVPRGANWWVTRDVDGHAYEGTPTDGTSSFYADLQGYFPARTTRSQEFYVHSADAASFLVRQPFASFFTDQTTNWEQSMYIPNPYAPGGYDEFRYYVYTASIDDGMSFALERFDTGQTLSEGETTWWGSFQLTQPPTETLTLDVLASRGSSITVFTPPGGQVSATQGDLMTETRPSMWPDGPLSGYNLDYYRLTLTEPAVGPWQLMFDEWPAFSYTIEVPAGYHDYREWYRPPVPLQFQISVTRFGHDLRLRQPHTGSEYYLNQQAAAGAVWENGQMSYYYFNAEAYYTEGRDFWIYDGTTGESAPLNSTGLMAWMDLLPPTIDFTADNGYGSFTLNFHFNSDYASDLILEQRPEDWSSDWVAVGSMPLSGATYGATYQWQINVPVGDPYCYRLRSVLGQQLSQPSNDVALSNPPYNSVSANYTNLNASLIGMSFSVAQFEWACDAPLTEGNFLVQVRSVAIGAWKTLGQIPVWETQGLLETDPNYCRYRFAPIGLVAGKYYQFRVRLNRSDDNYENYSPTFTFVAPPDTDKDGLPDVYEISIGTNPNSADSDGDGYSDGEEIAAGTGPLDVNSKPPYPPPGGSGGGNPPGGGDDPPPPPNPNNIPDIPVVNYASIDLTEITGVKATGGMAMGDDGAIAFYERTESGYRVAVWRPDGTHQEGSVPDKTEEGAPLFVVGINSEGKLAGNTLGYDKDQNRTISVAFTATPGWNGGEASFTFPFLNPDGPCYVEIDSSGCESQGTVQQVPLPSVVEGVCRMGGPWGRKTAHLSVGYECPNYYMTRAKHFFWEQVFADGIGVQPTAEVADFSDYDHDEKIDEPEVPTVELKFTPEVYRVALLDVSFSGTASYARWASSGEFSIGAPPPHTDRGIGFRADQPGLPASVERNKTNDSNRAVSELNLVTDEVQEAQDRVPSEFQEYVKIKKIIDNANGETLLTQAKIWKVQSSTGEPAWEDASVLLRGDDLHVAQSEGTTLTQACGGAPLAGTVEDSARVLLPADIAVDNDRNGLVEFESDKTASDRSFRFWINDDHDHGEDHDDMTGEANCSESLINGIRDLEDLIQLKFRISQEIIDLAREGNAQLGFKWTEITQGAPSIRVWSASPNMDRPDFLSNRDIAIQVAQENNAHGASARLISGGGSVWLRGDLMDDATGDTVNLLMEGVSVGAGKLTFMVKIGEEESEGGSIDVKLLKVRQMYERGKIPLDAPDVPDPWDNPNPPPLTWTWDPWNWPPDIDPNADEQTIVFVHGWRMTYDEYIQWADITFKRLWQVGFKGRFYSFRWPTYHGDNNGPNPADGYAPGGTTFNPSEYRAWLSGPAFANFVNGLPNADARYLLAHSLGNGVCGSALRSDMQVTRYAMCNAAVAAMAYDGTLAPDDPYQTPDTDPDFGTRQTFGLANKFNPVGTEIVSFGLPNDAALDKWSANNSLCKPQVFLDGTYYFYSAANVAGTKLKYLSWNPIPRFITSVPEAMSYVTASRTLAAGARLNTAGSVLSTVDMREYDFGTAHSAQWVYPLQKTYLFWRKAAQELEVKIGDR